MTRGKQFLIQYFAWLFTALPIAAAFYFADTLERTPWALALGVGLVASAALARPILAWSRRTLVDTTGPARAFHPGRLLVLAPALWLAGVAILANAFLDGSPPEEHASEVVRVTTGKSARVDFRDFREGGQTFSLALGNRALPANASGRGTTLTQGQPVTVLTRRGLFGWLRVEAVRPRS